MTSKASVVSYWGIHSNRGPLSEIFGFCLILVRSPMILEKVNNLNTSWTFWLIRVNAFCRDTDIVNLYKSLLWKSLCKIYQVYISFVTELKNLISKFILNFYANWCLIIINVVLCFIGKDGCFLDYLLFFPLPFIYYYYYDYDGGIFSPILGEN